MRDSHTLSMLKRLRVDEVRSDRSGAIDPQALEQAREIMESINAGGEEALMEWAVRLGDLSAEEQFWIAKEDLRVAFETLPPDQRQLLERVGERIRKFAQAQRASISEMETEIPGGMAGQTVAPVDCAGCYAPGGRYPLPSSVLMTAITARVAGVPSVWVASPRPTQVTLGAAHVAGADGLLRIGGAQAVGALARGLGPMPLAADVIVGPGNAWVTAAKALVQGQGTCKIDMLAGPSELLILADAASHAPTVAADLLAQAEHDPSARPLLVCTSSALADAVDQELKSQLEALPSPNRETAAAALRNGFAVVAADLDQAVAISDRIAPEHLEILTQDASQVAGRCAHYGAVFIGRYAAEVLGDYGCGPNHVLPTGGTARYTGGLSVHSFLRVRTWMRMDSPTASEAQALLADSVQLARLEGLEGHARAAEVRIENPN